MVVAMLMVMRGRWRRSGGGSGFLGYGVSSEANNERGGHDNLLDHELTFLLLNDHRGSSSRMSLIRLNRP
jgi:hypothetical protein